MIKPAALKQGDTIGIIAPSGAIKDHGMLKRAVSNIEKRGYKVKLGAHVKDKHWYLAGKDQDRLDDLMTFFSDPEIDAIFCARGGYGCVRLLDKIDYTIIKQNPKIFMGFSDITALHLSFYKFSDLITFHGPLAVFDLGNEKLIDYTVNNMWNYLEGNINFPLAVENVLETVTINKGIVKGQLIGGNLALLSTLHGSKYFPDLNNKILFIEDISEYMYRLDRYLMQLKISGVFETVNGIIFGEFTDIVKTDDEVINKLTMPEVIKDILGDIKTPAICGFSCGHSRNKATLPVGAECELDANSNILTIVEPFLKNS